MIVCCLLVYCIICQLTTLLVVAGADEGHIDPGAAKWSSICDKNLVGESSAGQLRAALWRSQDWSRASQPSRWERLTSYLKVAPPGIQLLLAAKRWKPIPAFTFTFVCSDLYLHLLVQRTWLARWPYLRLGNWKTWYGGEEHYLSITFHFIWPHFYAGCKRWIYVSFKFDNKQQG